MNRPSHSIRLLFSTTSLVKVGIILFISFICSVLAIQSVYADVGLPPWPLQGGSIYPGEEPTKVQMMREEVFIEIEAQDGEILPIYSTDPTANKMVGHVDANFWMQNQGEEEELLNV